MNEFDVDAHLQAERDRLPILSARPGAFENMYAEGRRRRTRRRRIGALGGSAAVAAAVASVVLVASGSAAPTPPPANTTPTPTASAAPRPAPYPEERPSPDREKALRAALDSALLGATDLPAALGARWRQSEDLLYCSEAYLDGHIWSKRQAEARSWRWLRSRDTAIGQFLGFYPTEEAADAAVAGLEEVLHECAPDSKRTDMSVAVAGAGWSSIRIREFQPLCDQRCSRSAYVYGRVGTSLVLLQSHAPEAVASTTPGLYRALGERVEKAVEAAGEESTQEPAPGRGEPLKGPWVRDALLDGQQLPAALVDEWYDSGGGEYGGIRCDGRTLGPDVRPDDLISHPDHGVAHLRGTELEVRQAVHRLPSERAAETTLATLTAQVESCAEGAGVDVASVWRPQHPAGSAGWTHEFDNRCGRCFRTSTYAYGRVGTVVVLVKVDFGWRGRAPWGKSQPRRVATDQVWEFYRALADNVAAHER